MQSLKQRKQTLSAAAAWLRHHPAVTLPLCALLVTLILEILSRRGLIEAAVFIAESPLVFAFNALIVLFTLIPAMLTRRRKFTLCLLCELWLILGTANFIVQSYRTTPLSMIDLLLAGTALQMVDNYLSPLQIVLILLGAVGVIALGVLLWLRSPRERIHPLRPLASLVSLALVIALVSGSQAEAVSDTFGNLAMAYDDLGFAYCFSTSVIDRGVAEPEDYSQAHTEEIQAELRTQSSRADVNVIFVQLESFFDPARYAGIALESDPIPVFRALKEQCSSGYLSMPSIGAGTANSEFEVLTGMNMDHFGAGEYPYKTVLLDQTCESLAYDFRAAGYTATAIHNHIRSFYGRDTVYANLGFDRFVSLEDMEPTGYTPTGWAEDAVLTGEILDALDQSEGMDFIYTVTVQAHGKYTDLPNESEDAYEDDVDLSESERMEQAWTYYAEQLSGTDAFIGALLEALSEYPEPTVVVLFGDHLPSLEIDESLLDTGDQFQTEYVLWSNFYMKRQNRDLQAYQLGAYVQQRLECCLGTVSALHQSYGWDSRSERYQQALQTVEYDLLYGERYLYGGEERYLPTQLDH